MVVVQHSAQTGVNLHDDKRIKEAVRVASTANVTITAPGTTIDGITMAAGNRVLLKNQSTAAQNGIYVWSGAAVSMSRSADADETTDFHSMFIVGVSEGTINGGTYWMHTTVSSVTVGSTSVSFTGLGLTTISGSATASDFYATGLTGATGLARFAGATTSGLAPTTGTFSTGDFVVDRANGGFWIATAGGSPGTWTSVGGPTNNAGSRLYLQNICI